MAEKEHSTIITEPRERGRGGWLIGLVLLLGILLILFFFSGTLRTERARDQAITDAAEEVGAAAQKVGDAADNAADGK